MRCRWAVIHGRRDWRPIGVRDQLQGLVDLSGAGPARQCRTSNNDLSAIPGTLQGYLCLVRGIDIGSLEISAAQTRYTPRSDQGSRAQALRLKVQAGIHDVLWHESKSQTDERYHWRRLHCGADAAVNERNEDAAEQHCESTLRFASRATAQFVEPECKSAQSAHLFIHGYRQRNGYSLPRFPARAFNLQKPCLARPIQL